jgi:hypothetical protein
MHSSRTLAISLHLIPKLYIGASSCLALQHFRSGTMPSSLEIRSNGLYGQICIPIEMGIYNEIKYCKSAGISLLSETRNFPDVPKKPRSAMPY